MKTTRETKTEKEETCGGLPKFLRKSYYNLMQFYMIEPLRIDLWHISDFIYKVLKLFKQNSGHP